MKIVVLSRDWKGSYGEMSRAKGMIFVGGESDLSNTNDSYYLVFVDEPTDKTAQELFDLWSEEEHGG